MDPECFIYRYCSLISNEVYLFSVLYINPPQIIYLQISVNFQRSYIGHQASCNQHRGNVNLKSKVSLFVSEFNLEVVKGLTDFQGCQSG